MSLLMYNYLFFVMLGGFIVLLLFSIMAFCNAEGLKMEEGKGTSSGAYLTIALLIKRKINRLVIEPQDRFDLRTNSIIELQIRDEFASKQSHNNRYD